MSRRASVDGLIQAFRAVKPVHDSISKLDVLMDFERLDDPRSFSFLIGVLRDPTEPEDVRFEVLTRLSDAGLAIRRRRRVGRAIRQLLLRETRSTRLRLQAAMAAAKFTDADGMVDALRTVLLDVDAPCELRYYAFTSLHAAGPRAETFELLNQLRTDESLGRCAQGLLVEWGVMLAPEWRASEA
jgi:hypothetical protein